MAPLKDVLLIGYGAVGAVYSLILKRSKMARVTVIARGNYDTVTKHGMKFRSEKYGNIDGWRPDRVFSSVSQALDIPYDYVVVTTKAIPEITRTSALLGPLLSPPYFQTHAQPTYVLMQNGLNVERDLYETIKSLGQDPKIVSTAVWIGTNMVDTNVVEHNHFDRVSLGVYRHNNFTATANSEAENTLLSDFAGMLKSGGTDVTVVTEIQRVKFSKNFWNIAFSSTATLTRHPLTAIFRLPTVPPAAADGAVPTTPPSVLHSPLITANTLPVLHAILSELVAVGHALGFPADETGIPPSLVEEYINTTAKLHSTPESKHRPSMLVDLEKGRAIEVEVIFGEVVRMAREHNVDIPVGRFT